MPHKTCNRPKCCKPLTLSQNKSWLCFCCKKKNDCDVVGFSPPNLNSDMLQPDILYVQLLLK